MDTFNILRELKSLLDEESLLLKKQEEEKQRTIKIDHSLKKNEEECEEIRKHLFITKDQISLTEKNLQTLSEQKNRLYNHGSDENKIIQLEKEISELENKGLELLEREENLQQELEDKKVFLSGLKKTYDEISKESSQEIGLLKEKLGHLKVRIERLEEALPQDFKSTLQRIMKKNLTHGPFTQIQNGSCFFCRFKISRIDESEIDMQKKLKTCPQCQRIFLPYGT